MINKTIYLLILIFGLLSSTQAQVSDSAYQQTLLWQVNGPGLSEPSYLYGTIHSICKEQIILPDSILNKIKAAKGIFFEGLGFKEPQAGDLFDSGDLMQRKSLQKLIGKEYFEKVKLILSQSNYYKSIDEATLNQIKPFLISKWIENLALGCKTSSYEDSLWRLGIELQKSIDVLERKPPPGFYHKDDIPLDAQAQKLIFTLKNMNTIVSSKLLTISLYGEKNITAVYNSVAINKSGYKDPQAELILDQRNKRWIPTIEKAMKKQATFFAFGCAHLAGENGVIRLLRKKGYIVTPIIY
ncbi:TraB/GumN family protein [Flavisolibacter tropicus]|uniref:Polysaccharide biosynthesis protein GumN n=1 Tax=Flavisolibacter tropicus TaxID=1492898 RepID=A0A172TYF7_9BACT|nr:TraB/GumN family protein [Flavisolibacter tropicus]ANE52129.1 hypothetical protein SY85_18155 [Flavisolibacter tropicus]